MCEQGEDKIDVNELLKVEISVKIQDWKFPIRSPIQTS